MDILVLTQRPIGAGQAKRLMTLRQELLAAEPENPYYRLFEDGMLSLRAFREKTPDRVVYWGTSGQRITDANRFDSFCLTLLKEKGRLCLGGDVRHLLPMPTYAELVADVARHLESICRAAGLTGRSLYFYGWLLDISRCLYTLARGG